MSRETPGSLPAINETTRLRTDLKTAGGIITLIVGAVVWCTTMWFDLQTMKTSARESSEKIDKIAEQVQDLRLQLASQGYVSKQPPNRGNP